MPRVFVYEHLCASCDAGAPLADEGRAMLFGAAADLSDVPGVSVSALVSAELVERPPLPGVTWIASRPDDERRCFLAAASGCDFALVIAPEFDDLLATRVEWAIEAGCRSLGPTPDAVRLCADKLRLARCLRLHGVPTPDTFVYDAHRPPPRYPVVVKPRSGAGAQATFVVRNESEYRAAGRRAHEEGYDGELIVQPFCVGQTASVSVIATADGPTALPPAEQRIETEDGRMRYEGGAATWPGRDVGAVVRQVTACVGGLAGWFGIGVVFGPDATVIEVNPRLTTSYVGLRRLACVNLMGALLEAARGQTPALRWRAGRVEFDKRGG